MEKNTSSWQLEITIISAEDLRINQRSIKKNAGVTIRSNSTNCTSTAIDAHGSSYPSWNEKLHLSLPFGVTFLTVEVQCKNGSGSCSTIGTASIPVSDFLGNHLPHNYLHCLSYRLKGRNGERNGIINFSIKVKGDDHHHHQDGCRTSHGLQQGEMYPMLTSSIGDVGQIVTGIPVSYGCPV